MNPTGTERDLWSLLHEGGHAIHALACAHHDLPEYRDPPLEMQELAAYFFEFQGSRHLDLIYNPCDAKKARQAFNARNNTMLAWVCVGDAFQHWVYTHPEHTATERCEKWIAIRKQFGLQEDWSGHEGLLAQEWQSIPHFFQYPLYSVEYVLAILGAQELAKLCEIGTESPQEKFHEAMKLGGSVGLRELWAKTGIPWSGLE